MSSHLRSLQTLKTPQLVFLHDPRRYFHLVLYPFLSALIVLFCVSCGGYFQTGSDEDETEITIELTPDDLESLFSRISESLQDSGMMKLWSAYARQGKPIKLGILAIENQLKVPLADTLAIQLKTLEEGLREEGPNIVSRSDQPELLAGLRDPNEQTIIKQKVTDLGQQLEAQFLLTGKLYSVSEDQRQGQTIQYFLFMQIIAVNNGAVRWQMEVETLKGR